MSAPQPPAPCHQAGAPRLRGRLHQLAFLVSLPAGLALVLVARSAHGRVATAVFAASLAGLYGTSASLHRGRWSPRARWRWDQADHAMIYVLIAGTYTPFALLALEWPWGTALLVAVWAAAGAGIAVVLLRHRARIIGITMYLTIGWLSVFTLPWLLGRLGVAKLVLLLAGGVLYTVGAVVLGYQWPDPNPAVFGYHEVWHAFTVAAGLCHYLLVWLLARAR